MNDIRTIIQEELPKSEYMEEMLKLCNAHRITPTKELPAMRFLFTFNDTPCFPICELVAGTGKAKSGKTLFMSMIMACALNGEQLTLKRIGDEPLTILWFDTEQSEQSTQDILLNRIMSLAGITVSEVDKYVDADGNEFPFDDKFYVLNVRGIGWEKRKELLQFAIHQYKPDLVILDGTKDLMLDINDATQATVTTEDLMLCSQINRCCIVNVLHQNKSEADRNMRGSIGTELTNKAFEAFECEVIGGKDDEDEQDEVFVIKHAMSRKKRSRRKLYYQLNDQDLPELCSKPDEQTRNAKGQFASPKPAGTVAIAPDEMWGQFNNIYLVYEEENGQTTCKWDLVKLFRDAFEHRDQRPYNQLMAAVMRMGNIKDKNYYYDRYKDAQQLGVIKEFRHQEKGDTWVELKADPQLF